MGYYFDSTDSSSEDDSVSAECPECGRVFCHSNNFIANENSMLQHMKVHDVSVSCPDCGKIFGRCNTRKQNRAAMKQHMATLHEDVSAQCKECGRVFDYSPNRRGNQNSLEEHMQVHKPRSVSCPVCGDTRFRSGANATAHVESGACPGCPGRDRARKVIYDFIGSRQETQHMLKDVAKLEYHGGSRRGNQDVPELPYQCNQCKKTFKHVSSLMQHEQSSHKMVTGRLAIR